MLYNTSVEMVGDELIIRIPKDFVYANVVYAPESTVVEEADSANFPDYAVMEDFEEFIPYLLSVIREEDETGWSLVNTMIHRAAEEAMEQGAEGVNYDAV